MTIKVTEEECPISPRLKPLEVKGLVWRFSKKVNSSGHAAVVWKAIA